MINIPKGARVRVTYEAVYERPYELGGHLVRADRDLGSYIPDDSVIEVLSEPDPVWWPPQCGDTALIDGRDWRRSRVRWYDFDLNIREDNVMREAELIIRAGERWTE